MKFKFYIFLLLLLPTTLKAQKTYFLSLEELFERGTENSLRIKASHIQEMVAGEKEKTARSSQLPTVQLNATAGYIGQPTIFRSGLAHPTHPDVPDWSHNYNVELTQPIYKGGKIEYSIRKATLEKQIARLTTTNNIADLKLLLLEQYIDLFTLHKQKEVLARNIEESKIRLKDIQRMWKEGLVTRNDEIRSELQLTNDELSYREATDNTYIVSQQLDIILGLDEELVLLPDTTLLYMPIQLQSCDAYIEQAYQQYPEIKLARYHTQLAMTDKRLAQADYLPTLSLHAGNTLSRPLSSTMEDMFSNNWNVALSLSYNLSSLYHNKHKTRETQQYINLQKNAE
ncbi:TolC family protein, partial [Phocaeicola sp.]